MIFNDDHGFDWYTWIKKGVNYVKAKDMYLFSVLGRTEHPIKSSMKNKAIISRP